jgi:hypothetical protein
MPRGYAQAFAAWFCSKADTSRTKLNSLASFSVLKLKGDSIFVKGADFYIHQSESRTKLQPSPSEVSSLHIHNFKSTKLRPIRFAVLFFARSDQMAECLSAEKHEYSLPDGNR